MLFVLERRVLVVRNTVGCSWCWVLSTSIILDLFLLNIQETRRFGFGSTCNLLFFHCSKDEEARCQGHTCWQKGCQGRQRKGCCKRKLSNQAKFCETCGQIRQEGPRHKFSFRKHVLRPLTPEETEEFPYQEKDAGAYRRDFGKHTKKSLSWLQEKVPSCIAWLVRERVYDLRPKLKDALISEGLFPESLLNLQDGKHLKSFSPGMRRKMTEM